MNEIYGISVRYDSTTNRVLIELDEHKIALFAEDAATLADLLQEAAAQLRATNNARSN